MCMCLITHCLCMKFKVWYTHTQAQYDWLQQDSLPQSNHFNSLNEKSNYGEQFKKFSAKAIHDFLAEMIFYIVAVIIALLLLCNVYIPPVESTHLLTEALPQKVYKLMQTDGNKDVTAAQELLVAYVFFRKNRWQWTYWFPSAKVNRNQIPFSVQPMSFYPELNWFVLQSLAPGLFYPKYGNWNQRTCFWCRMEIEGKL